MARACLGCCEILGSLLCGGYGGAEEVESAPEGSTVPCLARPLRGRKKTSSVQAMEEEAPSHFPADFTECFLPFFLYTCILILLSLIINA
jgi:hypothetical protein